MGGSMSRNKGHSWERETANYFKAVDPTARRNVNETQNRDCNQGIDVLLDNWPLAVQCKNAATWKGWDALRDARREGKIAVGVVKQTGQGKKRECAVLLLPEFMLLLKSVDKEKLSHLMGTSTLEEGVNVGKLTGTANIPRRPKTLFSRSRNS